MSNPITHQSPRTRQDRLRSTAAWSHRLATELSFLTVTDPAGPAHRRGQEAASISREVLDILAEETYGPTPEGQCASPTPPWE
jgi:hypothetical protein